MDLTKIDNDFSDDEVDRINTFVSNGCIGLEKLVADEHKVNSLFSLYMSGKTYVEISKISRVKKDLVLYMAAKMRWYEKRMEYLDDIQGKMKDKLATTRVESLNFISSLISMHHKYYGDVINEYLSTGNRDLVDSLDLKQLTQYFKSIDILEKVLNPANINRNSGSNNTININTSGSGKVEQVDDNTIEITDNNAGDLLKALAQIKDKGNQNDDDE